MSNALSHVLAGNKLPKEGSKTRAWQDHFQECIDSGIKDRRTALTSGTKKPGFHRQTGNCQITKFEDRTGHVFEGKRIMKNANKVKRPKAGKVSPQYSRLMEVAREEIFAEQHFEQKSTELREATEAVSKAEIRLKTAVKQRKELIK